MNTEIKDLSLKEIETFVSLYPSFDNFTECILDYIPDILYPFGSRGDYGSFLIERNSLILMVKDLYGNIVHNFSFPLDIIVNGTWKEYIDNMAQEERNKRNKKKETEKVYKEKKEFEEYQRLKEKFKDL